MRRIATAVDIDAPADAIWRMLVDFDAYPDWNPFIRRLVGEAKVGAQARSHGAACGPQADDLPADGAVAEPNRELRWLGRVLVPGIFDGEHAFVIEPQAKGCRLRHEGDVQRPARPGVRRHARRHSAILCRPECRV